MRVARRLSFPSVRRLNFRKRGRKRSLAERGGKRPTNSIFPSVHQVELQRNVLGGRSCTSTWEDVPALIHAGHPPWLMRVELRGQARSQVQLGNEGVSRAWEARGKRPDMAAVCLPEQTPFPRRSSQALSPDKSRLQNRRAEWLSPADKSRPQPDKCRFVARQIAYRNGDKSEVRRPTNTACKAANSCKPGRAKQLVFASNV